ncbi:ubiquinol-cytochrome-c reductase complex assembly factor 1 [Anoplophora glabripennis]|uniref:ubiquinol-cytochrome-c reductase complex assembly factor 1 n=1 Tax=Anoplophora glabripennis TaxID=217634 RepID=UPI000873BF69|nr:ubiquinol-cytochrome-c reductase complex assembly factor 1 [Anoplophora glabripennis]
MNITRFVSMSSVRRNVLFQSNNRVKTCCSVEKYIFEQKVLTNLQLRHVSTYEVKSVQKEGLMKKVLNKIPFFDFNKLRVSATAYLLYEGIADQINYAAIFEELDLPDTFYSWFVITELYIWMLSVRAMAEETDGRHLRNGLVEALWLDVAQRVKKLGVGSSSLMKEQVFELSEQLQAALLSYDEGLQGDDIVLAGALWRRFYQLGVVNPENLVTLVKYIRKQIALLDNMSKDQILTEKAIRWEPLHK